METKDVRDIYQTNYIKNTSHEHALSTPSVAKESTIPLPDLTTSKTLHKKT